MHISEDYFWQEIDGILYKLRKPYDFSFISKYGTVFRVFDQSSSGCICSGMVLRKYLEVQ
jgi:serine/threonine-protein kinase